MSSKKNITVVGAGLVGSLVSIYLAKRGHKVDIYERRPDMREADIIAGRSINLALSDRGWRGLEGVGIADEIKKIAIPMYGRSIHMKDGSSTYQAYGKDNQAIYSVSRGGINMRLMDLAEQQPNVKIHFEERCDKIDRRTNELFFHNTNTDTTSHVKSDFILGSDGAFSAVRTQMQLQSDRFDYQQFYIDCGYKELVIPAGANGEHLIEKNCLHIWPRGSFMMIALPNMDGSFTCTLFFQMEGKVSFEALKTKEEVLAFFKQEFPDAVPLMPTLLEDYFANPTSSLVTVKCKPWVWDEKIALIGDAAHAIVPFYGQGMNCGFEDCVVLNELMEKHGDLNAACLKEYETLRKPDGDAIADLAIANFIEMRDKTADKTFLLQKKIEAHFSAKHPEKWIPLYSMVTYTPSIRYSEALIAGNKQQAIMDKIMMMPDIENKWDSTEVENAILKSL
ncbi:MAG: FAD-dependent monooxygenase [Bacteroidetes bacterium]|jgi:kynurenine 3-monooxygenase|nr:FAD-dependent monooxygenase [Bacteroidota bacterium]